MSLPANSVDLRRPQVQKARWLALAKAVVLKFFLALLSFFVSSKSSIVALCYDPVTREIPQWMRCKYVSNSVVCRICAQINSNKDSVKCFLYIFKILPK